MICFGCLCDVLKHEMNLGMLCDNGNYDMNRCKNFLMQIYTEMKELDLNDMGVGLNGMCAYV